MYLILFLLCFTAGGGVLSSGLAKRRPRRIAGGVLVILITLGLLYLMGFWVDMLWFDQLGFSGRFWKAFLARAAATLVGTVGGMLLVALSLAPLSRRRGGVYACAVCIAGLIGFLFGSANWQTVLIYNHRVMPTMNDPILGRSIGFYLFSLPFYSAAAQLFFLLMVVAVGAAAFALFVEGRRADSFTLCMPGRGDENSRISWKALYGPVGGLLLAFALKLYVRSFHLLYSSAGVVTGPGWTDARVRLPVYRISAFLALLSGLVLLVPWTRRSWKALVRRVVGMYHLVEIVALSSFPAMLAGVLLLGLSVVAPALQWLLVEPNEISLERPYISHNIRFTRHAYNLDIVERSSFSPSETLDRNLPRDNRDVLAETRLWDWRALKSVYRQFQEIRLYYALDDVDVDRYRLGGRYRQVMVSPREIDLGALPEKSQTFVNRRFKYTHGYGVAMSLVHEFTPDGLPRFLIEDIPPSSHDPSLRIQTPQIYYGTISGHAVVVNSREKEFDYPKGEDNVYSHYAGDGGIRLKNLWRKFVLGPQLGGTRFLFSRYPRNESRIMIHRNVRDRVRRVAPFLALDTDPYIVVSEGKLWWILDAYTLSSRFPYSEVLMPYEFSPNTRGHGIASANGIPDEIRHFRGANYVRNSVKAVVDAYTGKVSLHVFDSDDPILAVWRKVFPDLFSERSEMPADLERHVRYPVGMLLTQGLAYAQYHMENPEVFYNQEDVWVRATEKYYGRVQPVEPYYIMWQPPEGGEPEFCLMMPFTPKNKQVLIGWIAGLCDQQNYGRLLAYKMPKERRVLGPQQVETKIDQDPFLSSQLSLWDQRGSRVIRGNLLALPVSDTLIYVEPIYLQSDTAAYPELRLVAVMHGDTLSYAETFDQALHGLFEEAPERQVLPAMAQERRDDRNPAALIREANDALNRYLDHTAAREFEQAGRAFRELTRAIEALDTADEGAQAAPGDSNRTVQPAVGNRRSER